MTVIVAVVFASGQRCPYAGQYLQWFDFDAYDGRGVGAFTPDRAAALEFPDFASAMTFWKTVSWVKPFRADGEPNRPLTALTVEIKP